MYVVLCGCPLNNYTKSTNTRELLIPAYKTSNLQYENYNQCGLFRIQSVQAEDLKLCNQIFKL